MGILGRRERGGGELEEEDGEGGEWRRWVGREEGGGERGGGGGEEVGELLEDGHLVDECVDVWDVCNCGQADAGEEWVAAGWLWEEGCGGGW